VPIVFVQVPDPVGAGFVDSLARLELLKEISPRVTRAVVLRDPASPDGIGQFAAIQSAAPSLGVEVRLTGVREAGEIERAAANIASGSGGGLIVTASGLAILHRELIVTLASRHLKRQWEISCGR
jgi:putative ABC transport system substrate-binding protein